MLRCVLVRADGAERRRIAPYVAAALVAVVGVLAARWLPPMWEPVVQTVLRCVRDLNREGLTCVLVEQNVAVSLKLASRAYVLENGRVTLSGTGAALLVDDRVRQAYLGL